MTEPHKRNRHPKYKAAYRVNNWREYEQSLRDRDDITLWISQDAIDAWTPPQTGKRDAQPVYSDVAIETALTFRLLFHLALRQTEGFLGSVLRLMGVNLPCPDHTCGSRKPKAVEILDNVDWCHHLGARSAVAVSSLRRRSSAMSSVISAALAYLASWFQSRHAMQLERFCQLVASPLSRWHNGPVIDTRMSHHTT